MEVTSIVAILLILGFGYYLHNRSQDKAKESEQANARSRFIELVDRLDAENLSEDSLVWLDAKIRTQTGQDGLNALSDELDELMKTDVGIKQAKVQLMLIQQQYVQEMQSVAENIQWQKYVEAFRQMNKAQQAHQIEKMKSVARSGSNDDRDKIDLLELIHMGDRGKTTDVIVGGIKLFSLKEK